MGFFDKIKKYAEGAVAQVNPFDDGKTYSSVVSTPRPQRQPAPVQTPKQGEIQRAPQRNFLSRAFDQVNPFDSGRTYKQATPTRPNKSLFQQATHNGITNFAGSAFVKPVTNTFAGTIIEPARSVTASFTGNEAAREAAERRKREAISGSLPGMIGETAANWQESWGNLGRQTSRGDVQFKRDVVPTVGAAAEVASYGVGGGAGGVGFKQGSRELFRNTVREAGKLGGLQFTADAGRAAANPENDWGDIVEEGGRGAAFAAGVGAGLPLLGRASRKTIDTAPTAAEALGDVPRRVENVQRRASALPERPRYIPTDEETALLSDLADAKMRRWQPGAEEYGKLQANARELTRRTGVDFVNGAPGILNDRVAQFLDVLDSFKRAEQSGAAQTKLQGGFAKIPGIGDSLPIRTNPYPQGSLRAELFDAAMESRDLNIAATDWRSNNATGFMSDRSLDKAIDEVKAFTADFKPQRMTMSEAQRILDGERMQSVGDVLQSSPGVRHTIEPDTPLQPGIVEGRDLLSKPFIDLGKAPAMERLPAVTKPRPELEDVSRNIEEFPESGMAVFDAGVRQGRDGETIRVREAVKRSQRGGLESQLYSPDAPVTAAADDVMKDANLLRGSDGQVSDKTVKQINADQRALLNQWLGTRTAADIEGIKRATNTVLDELPTEKHEAFVHAMEKDPAQWTDELRPYQDAFRKATDELYDLATENGVNMNKVRAYITHIWDEKTLPKPDSDAAEVLFNPFHYGNERKLWNTYADAAEAGVKMKYKDPRKILAVYTAELHKTMADISYIKRLKDEGVVVEAPAGSRPDLQEIVIPEKLQGSMENPDEFMSLGNTLYTTKENARVINETLSPSEPVTGGEKFFHWTAKAASRLQDIGLSGGIWGTPVNAFSIAQAVKEMTAGRFKGPLVAFSRSMTNKQANKYFAENDRFVKEMLKEGVPFQSSYDIPTMAGFAGQMRDANTFGQRAAATWDALVSDPTFKRFLPMMQVELYKDIRRASLKKGMSERAAKKAAGESVRKFYGLRDTYDLAKRNKFADDILTTVMFAPKYRAAMMRMWLNTVKALGNPRDMANRTNLRFAAGAILTYGMMNALNYAANGTPMWGNPDGKEDKLLLPGNTYVGIPFLSSVATVPKYLAKTAKHSIEGKGDEVMQDLLGFASYGLRPLADVFLTNESWSGRRIVDEDDTASEKAIKRAGHITTSYMPTWLRENTRAFGGGLPEGAREFLQIPEGGQPGYKTATNLLELPVRYYDPTYFRGQSPEFRGAPGKTGSVASLSEAMRLLEQEDADIQKRYNDAFSAEDLAITRLSNDDRDRLIERGLLTQDKVDNLDRYALGVRQKMGLPAGSDGQGTPKESKQMYEIFQDFYKERAYVHDKDLDGWRKKPVGEAGKQLLERASGMLRDGWPALPQTNEVAEMYAEFSKDRKEGDWSKTRELKEKRKFLKNAYMTTLEKTERGWLTGSDSDIRAAIEDGELSADDLNGLVAFDDRLREMGLPGQLGVTLRRDYGYKTWSKSRSGRSGGGRRRNVTPSLGADFFSTSSIVAQLNRLLGSASL